MVSFHKYCLHLQIALSFPRKGKDSADDISIYILEGGQSSVTTGLLLVLKIRWVWDSIIQNRPLHEVPCSTTTRVLPSCCLLSQIVLLRFSCRPFLAPTGLIPHEPQCRRVLNFLWIACIKALCLPFIHFTGKRSCFYQLFVRQDKWHKWRQTTSCCFLPLCVKNEAEVLNMTAALWWSQTDYKRAAVSPRFHPTVSKKS